MAAEGAGAKSLQSDALRYWNSVSADTAGMLGGFPQVSRIDLQGSANFIAKLRRRGYLGGTLPKDQPCRLARVADCGAGIGRISLGLLCGLAEVVDIVEPVEKFTKEISAGDSFAEWRSQGRIGTISNLGLEEWEPDGVYDLFWNQWCLGQLNDTQLEAYLVRCRDHLSADGVIVVKENNSNDPSQADLFDEVDSSFTRSKQSFLAIFERAGLKVLASEKQTGMPKELFTVAMFALRPQ